MARKGEEATTGRSSFRGQAAVYLTDPQIDLVVIAIDRLLIEMNEVGRGSFTASRQRALETYSALVGARIQKSQEQQVQDARVRAAHKSDS